MTIKKQYIESKPDVISNFAIHTTDTGSSAVQIALLTKKIEYLTEHVKQNRNDNSARRSLLMIVSLRLSLLKYLKKIDYKSYDELTTKLNIKKK